MSALFLPILLLATCCSGQTFPQTVELDLIFPRNETYAPIAYFPIVFAIQNIAVAWPLGFSFTWRIGPILPPDEGVLDADSGSWVPQYNAVPDPFLFINSTTAFNHTEHPQGAWYLAWEFGFHYNCSINDTQISPNTWEDSLAKLGSITFTMNSSTGKVTNILEAETCPLFLEMAEVEDVLNLTSSLGPYSGFQGTQCAVLGDQEQQGNCSSLKRHYFVDCNSRNANPCAIEVDESVASSVSTAMMSAANCMTGSWPNITARCEASSKKSLGAKIGTRVGLGSMTVLLLVLGLAFLI